MTWTTDKPSQAGFYWYRQQSNSPALIIEVTDFRGELVSAAHEGKRVSFLAGEFAGPLEGPLDSKGQD